MRKLIFIVSDSRARVYFWVRGAAGAPAGSGDMFGGRSIRGLSLGVIIGATALAACGSKREEVSSSRATASTAPAPLPSAALARAEGSVLASGAHGFSNKAKGRAALAAVVPGQANQATRLSASGVHVELQAEGAAERAGELDGGRVVYRDAFTDTDVVLAAHGARLEELRVLRSAKAPAEARYRIRTNSKVRQSAGTVAVLDPSGRARLRTLPAFAIDAAGKTRVLQVRLDTSGPDPVLIAKLDTAGLTYPITVDPTWVSGDWPSEAVVALNSVWLKEHSTLTSTVNGAVAVIDASPGPVLAESEEAVVGQNVTVTGTVSANRVRIKLGGVVNGDVRENSLINNGTINGATVTPLALPLAITAPTFPTFSAGTTAVTLTQHEDRTLAAGDYGQVTLQMGSVADPTVLTLGGGIYNFDGLNVGEKSRVECASACEIRIKGRLEPGEDSFIGPAAGSGLTPAEVEIFVEGINGSSGALGGTPRAAVIGFDSSVQARLYAANGTLWIKSGTTATGTFVARDVLVGEGVSVSKDTTGACGPIDDGNPCTADSCDEGTGTVHHDPLPAGTSCSNGNACDGVELCDGAGTCQPGTPPDLDDGNACTTDACSPSGGVTHAPVAAGTACGDGNACNGDETCDASGTCQNGTPPDLDDGDACTADSCDPQAGVVHAPLTGTACDDGDGCTQTDTCQAGTCTGSNPVVCTALDQCHLPGTCSPSTGTCSNPPKANGSACNDANSCTQTDTCQAGTCTGSNPVVCTALDQCHVAGSCDPGTGVCSNPAKADGSACSDGDACTQTDSCQAGTCTGSNPIVCTASDQCHDPGICDSGTGVCSNPAKPDGSSCDDANACTQSDSCQAGSCTGSNPVVCTALDQCHLPGTCSPSTGTCSNPPKPNGSACDDSSACTSGETCTAGSCGGGTPVATDDGNPCTADACDPQAGVSHTPVAAGTSCADARTSATGPACDGSGACQPGTPLAVDDGNLCTADACDPQTGVSHTPLAAGTSCADATLCNGDETCDGSGSCTPGAPPNADDGNPCTADACDPELGVTHAPVTAGTSCADSTVCNGAETCDATGICQPGAPLLIDDGNVCTVDACDPVSGVSHTPVAAGTSCADASVCNGTESCDGAGTCQPGTPPSLSDGNPCTADACDPQLGVTHTPAAAGTACGDGDLCNGDETCDVAGACQPGTPVLTSDGNPCTQDVCDPQTGAVSHPPAPAGTACNLDACTFGALCDASGLCVGGTPLSVDDGDACTIDICDPTTGPRHVGCAPLDRTVATNIVDSMSWLTTGANPVQSGVSPGTIDAERAAVLFGRVASRAGAPIPGVTVSVLGHPEFGQTQTHADGRYFMMVNGGGDLVVDFVRSGFLPAQRPAQPPWGKFASTPDVVLVALSAQVTSVELMSEEPFQVARGQLETDANGSRQATLLFASGTTASAVMPDGTTYPLTQLNVRATEYTVGASGPDAMPAPLPPASMYTYAVELSADEALSAGASVQFSKPVWLYLENFIELPVGTTVPFGIYDRAQAVWRPQPSGVVLKVLDIVSGVAVIDATGDGLADSPTETRGARNHRCRTRSDPGSIPGGGDALANTGIALRPATATWRAART
ncbi:MAG: hypothetical protein IPM35_16825 [Myxococcales bacterium]|nr:hypothetical protein [Myxococcales bacterium]